ncbi:MAG TPA: hypothetical protein VIF09_19495, partial [Polyangiaceae bacterium]
MSWWVCWALLLALFLATLGCGGSAASPAADAAPPDGAPPSDATDAGLADGPLPSFGDCGPGSIAQAPSGLMTIEDLYVDDGGIVIHTLDGIFAGPAGGPW